MYAVSAAFLNATRKGGQVSTRADVLSNGSVIATDLPLTAGSVDVDLSAEVRRRCSVSLIDDTGLLSPLSPGDDLSPYGNEIALHRGFVIGGVPEVAPLGVFRISVAEIVDQGFHTIALTGYDRARSVQRARLETPYTIAAGTNYATAIQDLIDSRLPNLTYNFTTTTSTTPLIVLPEESDPWSEAMKMAASIGMVLYFDAAGVCTLTGEPDASNAEPVLTYEEGTNATVISYTDSFNDDTAYNGMIVMGEPPDLAPVRAEAWDADPDSPTYYLGPYGRVPQFLRSQFVTTQAQADDAARAGVLRQSGATERLTITTTVNPAHEAGDVTQVQRAGLEIDAPYVVESFNVPLEVTGSMSLAMRKRRVTI